MKKLHKGKHLISKPKAILKNKNVIQQRKESTNDYRNRILSGNLKKGPFIT